MTRRRLLIMTASMCLILMLAALALMPACAQPEPEPTPAPAPAPAPTPAEPITLVSTSHEMPTTFWVTGVLEPWFAELEKRAGGRLKVEPHWGGELVNIMDAYDAVTKGTVDIAHFIPSMVTGRFTMDEITTFSTYDTMCWKVSRVYWELHQMFPEMGARYNDTKLLAVMSMFQRGLETRDKPIRKLEDMKGLKMLSSGDWAGARWEALGATPVSVPPGEAYMSLEKGIADASPTPLYLLEDWKLGEVCPYVSLVCTSTPGFAVAMNLNTFNSLPADIQKTMVDMGEYLVDLLDDVQYSVDKERYDRAIEIFGTEFIEIPEEELARWVEADKPVLDKFVAELEAKGMPGTQLKDEFQKLERKYAADEYYPW